MALEKPFFAPSAQVFGVAWGIIYTLIAIAFVLLVHGIYRGKIPKELLWIFILNMIANFMFTPILFGLKNNILAFFVVTYILITLAIFEKKILAYSKSIFSLMLPYLLWVIFATILQLSITILNL